jgi:sucrose phosphorylase
MKNQVQLITYIDRLASGGIRDLAALLSGPLQGLFSGVHLLPFFTPIDGADAGFDPIDHTKIDPRLGDWADLRELAETTEIMADVIVNHISRDSPQFLDFSLNGRDSPYADLFLTYDRVFPEGATEAELLALYRPRPGLPFSYTTLTDGSKTLLWTTFAPQQIDIDVTSAAGRAYLATILGTLHQAGVTSIRLDAAGYAVKKAGTNCFMLPETFDFIADLTQQAHALGIDVLVEIHSHHLTQIEIAGRVDWVYDFALPPLLLHTLYWGDATALTHWLAIRPTNAITVLDTHDGIGVIDIGGDGDGHPGLLPPEAIDALVDEIHRRSRDQSRQATGTAANNLDLYQVNCTYFDALGQDATLTLIARAIQFFIPGIPQVYYGGLLAAANDMALLEKSGVGRDINRPYVTPSDLQAALTRPVVQSLMALIRLRNRHSAFQGSFTWEQPGPAHLTLEWRHGTAFARLSVDLMTPNALIETGGDPAHSVPSIQLG